MYVAVKVSNGWVLKYGAALIGKEDIAKDGKICYDADLAIRLMAFAQEISGLFKTDTNS